MLATLAIATVWHSLHSPDLVVLDQLIGDFVANEHVTEALPSATMCSRRQQYFNLLLDCHGFTHSHLAPPSWVDKALPAGRPWLHLYC